MKAKKIAALIAASTLLLSTVTAYADNMDTATGSANVSGSSTIGAFNNEPKYVVTLPTANALAFTVDPYGLLKSEEALKLSEIKNLEAGDILASGSGASIRNMSSKNIVVDIAAQVVIASGTASLVGTPEAVSTSSSTELFLALIPSANKVTFASGSADSTGYSAAGKAIPLTSTSSSVPVAQILLNAAEYEVVPDGDGFKLQIDDAADNYDATALQVGGKINSQADWSDFSRAKGGTISINAVFSYEVASDSAVAMDDPSTNGYGIVSGSSTNLVPFETDSSPKVSGTGITKNTTDSGVDYNAAVTAGTAYTYKVSGAKVTGAYYGNTPSEATKTYSTLTKTDSSVTMESSLWSGMASGSIRYIKITLEDKDPIIIKLNFN